MLAMFDWFDTSRFMPHGMCLTWDPGLLSLTAGSDAVIALSYYSIPMALLYFAARRDDVVFRSVLILFVVFILACGTTHILDVWTLWDPLYGAAAMVKVVTAIASVTTAVAIWFLMPAALAMPSARQLERANERLAIETAGHRSARLQAEELAAQFEARVAERTAELEQRTRELAEEVDKRRQANATLDAVIRSSPLGIVAIDPDHKVTICNPVAEHMHDISAIDLVGRAYPGLPDLVDGTAAIGLAALAARLAADPTPLTLKLHRRRRNGRTMDIVFSAVPMLGANGEAAGLLFLLENATERNQLEAQLRQSQKMEAVGQMTGGVAHDFNNLLAVILGNLELLRDSVETPAERTLLLQEAIDASLRGAKLTQHLLAFSRQQPLEPRSVRIQQLVADIAGLLKRTIGEQISIQVNLPDDLWHARIDPNQLENALLNLAINARDAMPKGGRLMLDAENVVLDPQPGDELAEIVPGPYVLLVISDTGTGMAPDVRERVLEPFFTTKPVGAGSGLGLSMVYGFVKQSGGHIKIYSEPGHGTSVRLYLPRHSAVAASVSEQSAEIPVGSGETILLVEDDAAVGKMTVRLLTGFGYRTIEARDAASALAVLEKSDHIDLMVTDVMLPNGVNGAALVAQVKRLRPEVRIMLISGYTKNAILDLGGLDEGVHFLAKPFPKAELARKIHQVLHDK
jgi:signal transduction histidine kinase/CheY-like chemotaxis protein